MPHAPFVHLRTHTAYSLSEGAITIKELIQLCRQMAMPAVAITDTSNLFGAMEFSAACVEAGIQPIIGCQLLLKREVSIITHNANKQSAFEPIVLLVQNAVGYSNILRIVSQAYLKSNKEVISISLVELENQSDGLILLTGGADGPIGRLLADNQPDKAQEILERLTSLFPGRIYVEIQRHGLSEEDSTETPLIELAYAMGLPLVATNEPFFATHDMYEAHDVLLCIASGAYLAQEDRRRLTAEHHFKTAEAMSALFADLPEAIHNTLIVAQRCAFMIEKRKPLLPPFRTGSHRSEASELRARASAGLEKRLETPPTAEDPSAYVQTAQSYWKRLQYELKIIEQMGFPGYFLIVSDFIQWAKANNVPVGPGRGSGAGSLVAWALTITDLDPLRFGLLFERFLNPERVSMPDFDIDFCQERRERVIRYVQDRYGYMNVAQIITFGKLQARAVLRDVGRVLQMPYGQVDRLCKLVPHNPVHPVPLKKAIEREPQLREMRDNESLVAHLIDISVKLEGLYRHASTHAAGVVIGDRRLDALVPLYRDPRSDMPVTQFNMKWVENTGLVKFDFLGLKTLTVLARALALIEKKRGIRVDLTTLPPRDQDTFHLLSSGETSGVFQLESSGMRDVLRSMKPDSLEDIIAVVALYRPGPMDNIPSYIRRKHGQESPDYLHPALESILRETYGIVVYQEQVMQIAQELAGYSLGGADLLRRAMGKKIKEEMEAQRKIFVDGAVARGVPQHKAADVFDLVAKFAEYGFNKSHAAAYAVLAYQTAYLKTNYTVEFMAATMTFDMHNTEKLTLFRQELRRLNIPLLPPDINRSEAVFTVEGNAMRYALGAIRNVGVGAMEALVEERVRNGLFCNITDFTGRLDPRMLNKRQVENLVKAGALDTLDPNRARLFDGAESLMRAATTFAEERASRQVNLFESMAQATPLFALPERVDWLPLERLEREYEAIGFYLSSHPIDIYTPVLNILEVQSLTEVRQRLELGETGFRKMAAVLVNRKERVSRNGTRYAVASFSDATGSFEGTLFAEVFAAARDLLDSGKPLLLTVDARLEDSQIRLVVQRIEALEIMAVAITNRLEIAIADTKALISLKEILEHESRGHVTVTISPDVPGFAVEILLPDRYILSAHLLALLQRVAVVVVAVR
ncbi:DNA polymerase III alpha subunit [invertebrate metagenome]|uniref:DNA-directed DNA polymerase n=1 Tax=invertebrate metagenome TaxID=1711999 RepID=A0A484H5L2_9ZZZZ